MCYRFLLIYMAMRDRSSRCSASAFHGALLFILYFSAVAVLPGWNIGVAEASHAAFRELQSVQPDAVLQRHRTGYHFQPPSHWTNDPNGPMYYKGLYHLFYQYNPFGSVWGNIVWAHSVSTDLINWRALPPGIFPSDPFDSNGTWSGSATILPDGTPAIMYTGILDAIQTQVQNIAYPADNNDRYLVNWTKPGYNPVIRASAADNATAFRDPTTAWRGPDGVWRVVIGTKQNLRGIAALFKSNDFKSWMPAEKPLHYVDGSGMWECPDFYPVAMKGKRGVDFTPEAAAAGGVGSEMFKYVLKVSLDLTRFDYYTVGSYDWNKDVYMPMEGSLDNNSGLKYDYGNFYASKTFYDPVGKRRILWGWANESDSRDDDIKKGWAGIQMIPRVVWLHKSGKQLVQWPVKEVEALRGASVHVQNIKLPAGSVYQVKDFATSEADVVATFNILGDLQGAHLWDSAWPRGDPEKLCGMLAAKTGNSGVGPFGLHVLASPDMAERTTVMFRVFRHNKGDYSVNLSNTRYTVLMCHDSSKSTTLVGAYKPSFGGFVNIDIAKHKFITLRTLIDNSVVETFGADGRTVVSSRVYPLVALGSNAHVFAFNGGTAEVEVSQLQAWRMKRPLMNN